MKRPRGGPHRKDQKVCSEWGQSGKQSTNLVSLSMNLKNGKREKPSLMVGKRVYLSPLSVKGGFIMDFFFPLLYFFFHYSLHYLVIWNHQLSQNPPSLLSCHPRKCLRNRGPSFMAKPEHAPLRFQACPPPGKVRQTDGKVASHNAWHCALYYHEAWSSPACLHSFITPTLLPCAPHKILLTHACFSRRFSAHLLNTGHGPPALHTSFTCPVLYLPLRKDLSL